MLKIVIKWRSNQLTGWLRLVTRENVVSTVIVAKWKLNKHGHWPAQIWQLCKYCAETGHRGSKKVEEELQNYFSSQFCKLPYFCDERLGLANMFCKYVTHFLCNQLSWFLHFFSRRLRANTALWICATWKKWQIETWIIQIQNPGYIMNFCSLYSIHFPKAQIMNY